MASPEETRAALVEALVRLARTRSLAEISVRDVAREAGINHGLVHRHFGSRENLIQAAIQQITAEIHAGYPGGGGLGAFTFRYLRGRPELVRILASACLEGRTELLEAAAPHPDRLCEIVASVRAALDRLGLASALDPSVLNAYAIASILGWLLFRPLLGQGFGVPKDADDQVEELLELLDLAISGEWATSPWT